MARLFGRILSSIWDDEDFLALDDGEQRMYAFLLSQKNLNHAGLLQLTLRKWARKARNSTPERVVAQLEALDKARFIVLDFDTEEVLVRTLVRNDSVYKQPRVMGAMVSDAREIESLRLRAALLAEVERIPLDELNDKPGDKGQPSIRSQVAQHIVDLHAFFGPLRPTPPQPPRHPLPDPLDEPPLEDLAEPPYDPLYDEDPEDGGQGSTRVHTSPRARALPYPVTPGPIPIPLSSAAPPAPPMRETATGAQLSLVRGLPASEQPDDEAHRNEPAALFEAAAVAIPPQRKPEPAKKVPGGRAKKSMTSAPETFEVTEKLAAWAWTEHKIPRDVAVSQTQVFLDSHRAKGNEYKDWTAAWRTWMSRVPIYHPQLLRTPGPSMPVNVPAAYQNPTTDAGYSGGWRRPSA